MGTNARGGHGVRIETASAADVEAVAALGEREGWDSWADRARTRRALGAPGASTLVVREDDRVVGAAHAISDGAISTYLGMLLVDASHRGQGIGSALIADLFRREGYRRMDLLTVDESVAFYERLTHHRFPGFRLYPEEP
jgi:ribosomal protein S18 acetylase RimI-like enzyme